MIRMVNLCYRNLRTSWWRYNLFSSSFKPVLQLSLVLLLSSMAMVAKASDFSLFQMDPFLNSENVILENGVVELSITTARNEYEPARFALESKSGASITGVELTKPRIDKSSNSPVLNRPEIHVLHQWSQMVDYSSLRGEKSLMHRPMELLVKNDLNIPVGSWNNNRYSPPAISKTLTTRLMPGIAKHFWISFDVPREQPAGIYQGEIVLKSDTGDFVVPYKLTVLDITLEKPDKTIGIFFRGSLEENKRNISKEMLTSQLRNIRDHSVDSLVIYEKNQSTLKEFIATVKTNELSGPIVLESGFEIVEKYHAVSRKLNLIKSFGYPVYLAGVDEPNTDERLNKQVQVSKLAKYYGIRTFTSLTTNTYKKLRKKNLQPNWSNINVSHFDRDYFFNDTRQSENLVTYYWQLYLEDMPRNRLYAGLFLFQSGVDGVMPYTYQAFHSVDPYSTDSRELLGNEIRKKRLYKNFMVTYPTQTKPIDTVQWESFREGVDDYRYISLLRKQIAVASKKLNSDVLELDNAREYINSLQEIKLDVDSHNLANILRSFRSETIQHILKLQTVLY